MKSWMGRSDFFSFFFWSPFFYFQAIFPELGTAVRLFCPNAYSSPSNNKAKTFLLVSVREPLSPSLFNPFLDVKASQFFLSGAEPLLKLRKFAPRLPFQNHGSPSYSQDS